MQIGDLVSHTDIFNTKHVGIISADYETLVECYGLQTYDHENLVEVLFFNGRKDVLFKEQLKYEFIAQ